MTLFTRNWAILAVFLPMMVLAQSPDEGQLSCLIEPSDTSDISSNVPGVLAKINVERGDQVRKGQVLFSLEDSVEKAAVELAKAQAEFAARKVERNQELFTQELISENERDEILTEHRVAILTMREAEARLEQRTIYSPFSGIVVERHISRGEFVSADPVITVASLDPLYVEVVMRADYYGMVKKGMRVEIKPENPIEASYIGKVQIADQIIDAASGTFGVRVLLDNPDSRLPSGLKCRVHYLTGQESK
jgi:membrane fusion protein (multidrug efflux system)